jgi:undecaprenyl-diphosphatase
MILTSNISYSQSSDSLLLVKTKHFQSRDSVINNSNAQMLEDFIDNTGKTDSYNTHLFRIINYHRSKIKDDILPGFTKSVFPLVLLMPLNTFLYGRIYHKTFDENTGYLLAVSEVADFIFTYGAKFLFKETRPYKVLRGVTEYTNLPLDPYAFPSAHTSFAFTIATTFALRYPKYPQSYVPIYMWAFLVAYSRPYLGVHYPVDVLGGFLIATGSSVLIYSLRSPLLKFKNHLFKEDKNDDGSINGGVVTIFAASFLVSELLTAYVFPDSPLLVSVMPSSIYKRGVNVALNYSF